MNKNLNFVPAQKTINKDTVNKQFEDFFRRIKLRAHFKNNKNKNLSSKKDSKDQQIKTGYPSTTIIAKKHLLKQHAVKSKKKNKHDHRNIQI